MQNHRAFKRQTCLLTTEGRQHLHSRDQKAKPLSSPKLLPLRYQREEGAPFLAPAHAASCRARRRVPAPPCVSAAHITPTRNSGGSPGGTGGHLIPSPCHSTARFLLVEITLENSWADTVPCPVGVLGSELANEDSEAADTGHHGCRVPERPSQQFLVNMQAEDNGLPPSGVPSLAP